MKKTKTFIVILICILTITPLFSACDKIDEDKLQVYASIYPLYFLSERIGGEQAQVHSVLPAGGSAHSYEPSLRQSGRMRNADIVILIGAGMEEWGQSFIRSLKKDSFSYFDKEGDNNSQGLLIVDTSRDLTLILNEQGEEEDHDSDHDHDHGLYDAHTWTSVRNMRVMAQSIAAAFMAKDEQNAQYYSDNFDILDGELAQLEEEYQSALAPYEGKSIVVSHKAFTYLCAHYGLNQIPVQINPDNNTDSLRQIAQMVEIIKEQNIKTLFWDNSTATSSFLESIQSEAKKKGYTVNIETLNPCETLSKKELKEGENYITVMEKNLAALLASFSQ